MSRQERFWYSAGAFLAATCAYFDFTDGYAGDKDWRLLATQLWLSGKSLYSGTFVDVNPPLIVWLYSLPVRMADSLRIEDYHGLACFGLLITALCIWLSLHIMAAHPQFSSQTSKKRQFLALLCFIFVCYPNQAWFFEREHIFVLLTFPYTLRWMPSIARRHFSKPVRVAIALLGALGFCIKPHCMLLLAGIQLLYILREKSLGILFSQENAIIYACSAIYALCVLFVTPHYLDLVLPMARQTYRADNNYKDALFYASTVALMFAVILADFRLRYKSPYRSDILYFLSLCPFLVAYIVANNGWFATYYPLVCYILLLDALLIWEARYLAAASRTEGKPNPQFLFSARACALVLILNAASLLPGLYRDFTFRCEKHIECRVDRQLEGEVLRDGRLFSFGSMSSVFGRWIELNRNTGARMEIRFHHLWMLPKFYASPLSFYSSHEWILHYVAQAYAEDLNDRKPDVMFIDDNDLLQDAKGSFLPLPVYLSRYPEFKKAWSAYRYDHGINYCLSYSKGKPGCRYDVYRRIKK